jgi:hypothetical protein
MIEGSVSVPLTNGSGSWRPKNLRLGNTALETALFHFFSYLNPSVTEAIEVEAEQVDQHT